MSAWTGLSEHQCREAIKDELNLGVIHTAGQHGRAARLYIESAALPAHGRADIWSRAASLRAARALARAGLEEDAAAMLRAILSESAPADERVFVEHGLRQF